MASAQLGGVDRLGDVAAGTGADDGDHVLGRVGHRQGEEPRRRSGRRAARAITAAPPPPGRWTSSSTTSGAVARMTATALVDVGGLADDRRRVARHRRDQLGPHTGAEQRVVVDQHDADGVTAARLGHAHLDLGAGARRGTSITAVPPTRWTRPTIDSLMPRRSAATVGRVEADAGVADEPGQLGVVGLDEHVDAVDVGVPGGVDDAPRGRRRPGRAMRRRAAGRRRRPPRRARRGRPRRRRPWRSIAACSDVGSPVVRRCRTATPAARAPGAGRGSPSAADRRCAGSAPATAAPSRGGGRPPWPVSSSRMRIARSSSRSAQEPPERRGGEDRQAADDDGDRARRRPDARRAPPVRSASDATPAIRSAMPAPRPGRPACTRLPADGRRARPARDQTIARRRRSPPPAA